MPIWIELPGLDFKYWGVKSLNKIVGATGKFMRVDQTTMGRENLSFARMLVEVKVDQGFLMYCNSEMKRGLLLIRICIIIGSLSHVCTVMDMGTLRWIVLRSKRG